MVRDPRLSVPVGREGRPSPSADGVDRRRVGRLVLAAVALVLGVVFILQNNDEVETTFLVFTVTARLWVGLLVTLVIGAFLGQAAEVLWTRRQRRE